MKRLTLAVLLLSTSFTPGFAQEKITVKIDPAVTHGTWEGWGTSLAWFAKIFGDRDDLADALFTTKTVSLGDQTLPGLGMTIARYNLGASSWNEIDGRKMVVSKIIQPFRQIEGFWLDGKSADPQSSSWDWSADAKQRALLLKAKARGAEHFELFSNSPMWWMCANDNPSGAADKTQDNLPAKNYPAFATYLATVARHAKDQWGVAFTSIEPFNEGTSHYWFADCKQEGCHFSAEAQIAFLPLLRAELDRQGLKDLPIAAADESEYDAALRVWNAYPPATKALVTRVNVHGYQMAKGDRAELHRQVVTVSGKKLWNSEHGDKFADGIDMARNLHRDWAALHPTAWCYWQPLDGGNNGGWGLLPANLTEATIGKANPKYFVFAQYSRHIRPGMIIVESGHANTLAAYDAPGRKLVLAVFNDGPARDLTFDLSAFTASDAPITSVRTQPTAHVFYQPQPDLVLHDRRFSVTLPEHTVQTFEITGVTLTPR